MRILIAEDAVVLRAGLERLLVDAGHSIVASVGDAAALLDAADRFSLARSANTSHTLDTESEAVDLAIVDVRMPPTFTDEGIRAAAIIRAQHPDIRVLVFSQYVEERYAAELIRDGRGGFGYLLKDRVTRVADFLDAINRINAGDTVLDPEVVAQILVRSQQRSHLEALTPRETEVLAVMAEGRSNAAIAAALVISPGVVEKHVSGIFTKLGLLPQDTENRRVLAVLRYLEDAGKQHPSPSSADHSAGPSDASFSERNPS